MTSPNNSPAAVDQNAPGALLNRFLNHAARAGSLSVEHVRHTVRQPESEAFTRKIASSFHGLSPDTNVAVKVTTISAAAGQSGLNFAASDAAGLELDAVYAFGDPSSWDYASAFALLQVVGRSELGSRSAATPAFSHNPVTVAAEMANSISDKELLIAADSVYIQSFCDVQAISKIARNVGNDAALKTIAFVEDRRTAGGDFGLYSKAPLSHDSQYALGLIGSQLRFGKQFTGMTDEEISDNSAAMAREGLSVWLASHGIPQKNVANLVDSLSSIGRALYTPPPEPAPSTRPGMRAH